MTQTWRALFGRVGEFNARIEENVGGIRVVQAFANEDHERALFAGDNARYRDTKLRGLPASWPPSMSLSYFSMRLDAARRDGRRRLFRAARRADQRRLRRLPAAGRMSSSARSRRSTRCWRPTRRASPASGATPSCSTPSPISPTRRMRSTVDRICAGDIRYERRHLRLRRRHSTVLRDIDLAIHAGRDGRLRRAVGRGQDDDLLAAAALLRGRCRAASPSTASTSAT